MALVIGLTSSIVAIVYICLLPLILQTYTPAWICWHLAYGHWNLIMIVFHYYKAITTSPGHPPQVRLSLGTKGQRSLLQLGIGDQVQLITDASRWCHCRRPPPDGGQGGRRAWGSIANTWGVGDGVGAWEHILFSDLCAGQERSHWRLHLQEMHCPQAGSHPPLQHLQQVMFPGLPTTSGCASATWGRIPLLPHHMT